MTSEELRVETVKPTRLVCSVCGTEFAAGSPQICSMCDPPESLRVGASGDIQSITPPICSESCFKRHCKQHHSRSTRSGG